MGERFEGLVFWGANNIYGVWDGKDELLCRIKGKVLGGGKDEYNPLAPGDRVGCERALGPTDEAWIVERLQRRNAYQRWNKKGRRPQTLAANLDTVVLITAAPWQHFRPRFVDRGLVLAEWSGIPAVVVVNKADLGVEDAVEERCEVWRRIGVPVLLLSARDGTNVADLVALLEGKTAALCGQSGVGKSTLLNRLIPGAEQRTAELSRKYRRGVHATVTARLFRTEDLALIDTPGVRELELWDIDPRHLSLFYPDFGPWASRCALSNCTHRHEPSCGVLEALAGGDIHPDRYEGYLRLYEELESRRTDG